MEFSFLTAFIALAVGFILLCKSADALVDGSVAISKQLGVSPLVIGLTIVSIGTSAPELAASIVAAINNNGSIAVGNVFGSNIANLALIGGVCAILRPIDVNLRILKVELPVMIVAILLLLPPMLNGVIGRFEGLILMCVFIVLLLVLIKNTRNTVVQELVRGKVITEKLPQTNSGALKPVIFIVAGLAGLILGAKITLSAAVYLGHCLGMSEAVIGLTIIAIGTSLPELITCLVASFKNQDDISTGNLVGSNIFNTLLVIGTASLVRPLEIEKILVSRDYTIMVAISLLFICLAFANKRLSRLSGVILLCCYVIYTAGLLAV